MKAMLFAAGLGTRLRPLTDTLPKCLVPVNDRPMIDYPLMLLRHYGIREIVVNVHHHAERVEEYLGDGSRCGVDIAYSREPVLLDTGGGLLGAKRFLDQDTFVIMNSDVLIDLRLDEVLRFHRRQEAAVTLVLRKDRWLILTERSGPMRKDESGNSWTTKAPAMGPALWSSTCSRGCMSWSPGSSGTWKARSPSASPARPTLECWLAPSAFAASRSTVNGRTWAPRTGYRLRTLCCGTAA